MKTTALLAAAALLLGTGLASAQAPAPKAAAPAAPSATAQQDQQAMIRMVHLAAHNQLGVLQYCQAQGSVDAETVALQRKILTLLPKAEVEGLDAAEASGKKGIVVFAGTEKPLADAATAQGSSVDAMCKQIATLLKSQAANLPK